MTQTLHPGSLHSLTARAAATFTDDLPREGFGAPASRRAYLSMDQVDEIIARTWAVFAETPVIDGLPGFGSEGAFWTLEVRTGETISALYTADPVELYGWLVEHTAGIHSLTIRFGLLP